MSKLQLHLLPYDRHKSTTHYGNGDEAILALENELKLKNQEVTSLHEKVGFLEEKITQLEEVTSLLRNQK